MQLIVPLQNLVATPSIAFGDGNSGFFESADNILKVTIAGAARFQWNGTEFRSEIANGASLFNRAATATIPVLSIQGDSDTGIGRRAPDIGVLIAGAQNCMEFGEAGAAPLVAFYGTAAIAKQLAVPVTAAGIHAALVALGLIT